MKFLFLTVSLLRGPSESVGGIRRAPDRSMASAARRTMAALFSRKPPSVELGGASDDVFARRTRVGGRPGRASSFLRAVPLLACVPSAALMAAPDASSLRTATVSLREVDQTYVAEGVVEAVRQSTVSAQISGRVVEVNFDVGDRVEKGQVILRIDAREASQVLAGSQAQVEQARAVLARAKAEYDRTRLLISQKFVSEAALDKAAAEYKAAQAQLANTLAGAGQAATTRGFATVVAPYGGVVSARHVELGEMAVPGKPLMTGFDPSSLRVVASIPQYKLASIGAGVSASVEIPAFKQWVKAQSVMVLPIADPQSLTTQARLDLPAMPPGVFPGMFARAHFIVGRAIKLMVPAEAVLRRSEVTAVYVIDARGLPQLRQVRLGESAGQEGIEVLAGLKPGERVALDPIKAGMLARQR